MTDEEVVGAMADLLGLGIDPAHRPGVVANMAILRAHARRVLDFPIDAQDDGAGDVEP